MSIYGRRKGVMDFDRVDGVQPPPQPEVRGTRVADYAGAGADDFASMRKARPANELLPATQQWFRRLPTDVAPRALVVEFPRILNLIALQWNDRLAAPAYFDDLLLDRRGGRRGFPPAVRNDIQTLRDFWYTGER